MIIVDFTLANPMTRKTLACSSSCMLDLHRDIPPYAGSRALSLPAKIIHTFTCCRLFSISWSILMVRRVPRYYILTVIFQLRRRLDCNIKLPLHSLVKCRVKRPTRHSVALRRGGFCPIISLKSSHDQMETSRYTTVDVLGTPPGFLCLILCWAR